MFVFLVFSVNISCISSLELPVGKVVLMLVLYQEKYGLFIHLLVEQKNLLFIYSVLIAFCSVSLLHSGQIGWHCVLPGLCLTMPPQMQRSTALCFQWRLLCYTQVLTIVRGIWK